MSAAILALMLVVSVNAQVYKDSVPFPTKITFRGDPQILPGVGPPVPVWIDSTGLPIRHLLGNERGSIKSVDWNSMPKELFSDGYGRKSISSATTFRFIETLNDSGLYNSSVLFELRNDSLIGEDSLIPRAKVEKALVMMEREMLLRDSIYRAEMFRRDYWRGYRGSGGYSAIQVLEPTKKSGAAISNKKRKR